MLLWEYSHFAFGFLKAEGIAGKSLPFSFGRSRGATPCPRRGRSGALAALSCMSSSSADIHVRVGSQLLRIQVSEVADSHEGGNPSTPRSEWDLVSAPEEHGLELEVATGPPPLHLVKRSRLSTAGSWDPTARIVRAFEFGKEDCLAALEQRPQRAADTEFPLRSQVYVILYDPTGNWPRYTNTLCTFYREVKVCEPGKKPDRQSRWREGVVSRGFPSLVEAEAYLLGAKCRLPSGPFAP